MLQTIWKLLFAVAASQNSRGFDLFQLKFAWHPTDILPRRVLQPGYLYTLIAARVGVTHNNEGVPKFWRTVGQVNREAN